MVVTFGIMYVQADVPIAEVVRGFTVPQLPRRDIPVVSGRAGGRAGRTAGCAAQHLRRARWRPACALQR